MGPPTSNPTPPSRYQRRRKEPVDDCKNDESSRTADGDRTKSQQPGHEDEGGVEIQRSRAVGQVVGAQTSECGSRVGQGDGLWSLGLARVTLLHGVELDVEEEDVDGHETEAEAETEGDEGGIPEGIRIVEFPSLERWLLS